MKLQHSSTARKKYSVNMTNRNSLIQFVNVQARRLNIESAPKSISAE